MSKIICSISLGDNIMDNDYTIYEDGSVERYYDKSIYDHSIEDKSHVSNLSSHTKAKILEKCSDQTKLKLEELFNTYQ